MKSPKTRVMNQDRMFFSELFAFALVACFFISTSLAFADKYWPGKEWRTATPESQGISSMVLADMLELIWDEFYRVDSVLIVRNGYVVLDAYNHPSRADQKHPIFCCTKSITSVLVGIAIDKGYIQSVDQPLLDFFPYRTIKNSDDRKQDITLKHVLTMTTGLKFQDSYVHNFKGLWEMRRSDDWIQYMLDLPMAEDPGARFEYSNGGSNFLTAVIEKTTGKTAFEFAKEVLFAPLRIDDVLWKPIPQGITSGSSGLSIRPRDLAKIGYLFLNKGKWNYEKVVSNDWLITSTTKQIEATEASGYGYQWWVEGPGEFATAGRKGQRMYVSKDKQMIVVFTGQLEEGQRALPEQLLKRFILPAVKSETALPENPESFKNLENVNYLLRNLPWKERGKM